MNMENVSVTENITNKKTYALECTDLRKKYGRREALKGVSLTVKKGHIAAVLGPDGSGKTTLAKLICSLSHKTGGNVLIDGKPLDLKDISYLPEYPFVNPRQRVGDIVEMYRCFYDDFNVKRAVSSFKRIEISLNDKFCYLSRSSIQKVETVLVMSRKAKLYLLDDPIVSVEPKSRDFIIKTVISNCDENSGVLITSAIASQIEKILDEVYILHKGEIKLASTAEDIMNDYGKTVSGFYREAFGC